MSISFYVECETCHETVSCEWESYDAQRYIRQAYQHLPLLVAVDAAVVAFNDTLPEQSSWGVEWTADLRMGTTVHFLVGHAEHTLTLYDEYGYRWSWEKEERLDTPEWEQQRAVQPGEESNG